MLAVLAAVQPSASDGRGENATPKRARAAAHRAAVGTPLAVPGQSAAGSTPRAAGAAPGAAGAAPGPAGAARRPAGAAATTAVCEPAGKSSGYVNPLASTVVRPKRIDQGVDYAGSGTLTALGPGTITEVATTDTGWPGAFIEYQLVAGPAAGCYVFYAEGVTPASGLQVGQLVRAGQPIATIIPGYPAGIEIGWGAGIGTETYAAHLGEWSATNDTDSIPTGAGRSFSALIAALGGPPGKVGG